MSFLKLIVKNPFRNRGKVILSIFGLTLAVLVLLTLFSFAASVESSIDKSIVGGGDLAIIKITNESEELDNEYIEDFNSSNQLNETDVDFVKSMGGVKKAIPLYVNYGFESSVIYFNHTDFDLVGIDLIDGRIFNNLNEIVVSKNFLDDGKHTIGDKVTIHDKNYTIVGVFKGNNMYTSSFVALPLSEMQYNKNSNLTIIEKIIVVLDDSYDSDIFSENIRKSNKDLDAMSSSDYLGTNPFYYIINQISTYIYLFAIIFGATIVLYSTLSSVNDRTREIGVLKSVGWDNKMIVTMIMAESFVFSLISWIIGSIISIIIIEFIISKFLSFVPVFSFTVFINTMLIIVVIAILGGIFPTYRAVRISPTEALSYE